MPMTVVAAEQVAAWQRDGNTGALVHVINCMQEEIDRLDNIIVSERKQAQADADAQVSTVDTVDGEEKCGIA